MRKYKYLTIFLLPLTVWVAFQQVGWLTFIPLFVFFIAVPLLELIVPKDRYNLNESEIEEAINDPFYQILMYTLVPVQILFLIYFLNLPFPEGDTLTLVGRVFSMGIMCGVIGINLGHELGHRHNTWELYLGEILMLTSLENHFIPYHNRGHHYQVATRQDPATARKGEWLYVFWFRSQIGSYIQAWKIEMKRMKIMQLPILHWKNKMVIYTLVHALLLASIYAFFGFTGLLSFLASALIGILLLETVNYIEHYGLLRQQDEKGVFERVKRKHSWNSDHFIGRALLFELSRHSDHHYKADKPYQILASYEDAPQMPTGYPGMMVLALFPPLFFSIVHPHMSRSAQLA